ncbi:MAG: restriction endonuclease subunit S, partial [Methanophagales archaeon]|nr:restriction endonuclease subunit S [Methanophagales archaeon]
MKLSEVVSLSRESVEIDPLKTYKQITVRLHHKGVVLREEKIGQRIKSKQYLAKEGQFIISRIDARNGAMGLVPQELDGAIVTNDFLLYVIDGKNIFTKYFDFLASTKSFVWECIKASKGTTNRVRLKPEKFLEIEISLPLLEEQKRIVAKIESVLAKVEEARRFRAEARRAAENILELFLRRIFLDNNQYDLVKLGDKNFFELNPSKSELSGLDDDIDVSFVPMTYVDPESGKIKNFDIRKLFEVRKGYTYFKEGDVLFAKITPCMENGNVAIAQNIINGIGFGTTEFHVVRVLEKVLPKWVYYLFRTKGFRDIAKGSMT